MRLIFNPDRFTTPILINSLARVWTAQKRNYCVGQGALFSHDSNSLSLWCKLINRRCGSSLPLQTIFAHRIQWDLLLAAVDFPRLAANFEPGWIRITCHRQHAATQQTKLMLINHQPVLINCRQSRSKGCAHTLHWNAIFYIISSTPFWMSGFNLVAWVSCVQVDFQPPRDARETAFVVVLILRMRYAMHNPRLDDSAAA